MSKKLIIILLFLVFLGSSWALFKPGFFKIHDFTHAARVAEMTRALADGHFPVRWTDNFGFGYGMPLFEFYGPLPFYFGAFFYWLGLDMILVLKLMFLTVNLGTVLGAYLLGKKLCSKAGGVLTSAAFSMAPYRAVNLFVRGALSEAWGMMALPWILWAMVKVIKKEKGGFWQLVAGLSVLFLSHNLSVIIFAPFALIFAFVYLFKTGWQAKKFNWSLLKDKLVRLSLAGITAIGLSSFYLIPAFFEKDLTKVVDTVLGEYSNFRLHFLYLRQFFAPNWGYRGSEWGPNDGFSFFLGYVQLLGVGLSFLVLAKNYLKLVVKKKKSIGTLIKENLLLLINLSLILVSVLLTTQKTIFIWQALPLMEFIQFPWRFLIATTLFLSLALANSTQLIKQQKQKTVLTVCLTLLLVGTNFFYFRPESYLDDAQGMFYTDPKRIRHEMSGILPDYIPQNLVDEPEPVDQLILSKHPLDEYEILVDRTHQKLVRTDFNEDAQLDLAVASYPGWKAEINGQKAELITGSKGNIALKIPRGKQLVGVEFGYTNLRLISDLISLFSLLAVFYLLISSRKLKFNND